MEPSAFFLILKTYLQSIIFTPDATFCCVEEQQIQSPLQYANAEKKGLHDNHRVLYEEEQNRNLYV
jgi:hypothetical protein